MKYNDKEVEERVYEQVSLLLQSRGVKGWNMDRLAEQSGLAKNTLYRIIGSKEDVIEAVTLRFIHKVQTRLVAIIEDEEDYLSALQQVTGIFPELVSGFQSDSMQEIFNEYPRIEKSVRGHRDEMTGSIIAFLRRGAECGALRADIDAEAVFELLQTIVLHAMKSGSNGRQLSQKISLSFEYLLDGIRSR